jgi:hypothetical protein
LLELGFHPKAIEHRVDTGRLHPVHAGVFAVGRRELSSEGSWMAAVLACGPGALLSHWAAGALWELVVCTKRSIDVSVPARSCRRRPGITIHRRPTLPDTDITTRRGILVTSPVRTLLDLATLIPARQLERAVNEADRLDLIDPESLRRALEDRAGQPGVRPLRALLDRDTFRLTDSELERRFLAIARAPDCLGPRRRSTSMAHASTSTGPGSDSSSKPMGCVITAPRPRSPAMPVGTRLTSQRA